MKYLLCVVFLLFPISTMAEIGCIDDNYLYTIVESFNASKDTMKLILSFNEPIEIIEYEKDKSSLFVKDCFTISGGDFAVGGLILRQEERGVRISSPKGYRLQVKKKGLRLQLIFSKVA